MNDPWAQVQIALRSSNAKEPLKHYLTYLFERRKDQLVAEPTERNAGRATELRELLRDLFSEDVDNVE